MPMNGNGATPLAEPAFTCVSIPRGSDVPVKVFADDYLDLRGLIQNSSLGWVNYRARSVSVDGVALAAALGFPEQMVHRLLNSYYEAFEDNETEMGMVVPAIRISDGDVEANPVLILVREDLILTVHGGDVTRIARFSRYADVYLRKLPSIMPLEDKRTSLLIRILDENNTRNFDQISAIQERADGVSQSLMDMGSDFRETGKRILEARHMLMRYLSAQWRAWEVLQSLRHGDAELISDNHKMLAGIGHLADEVTNHISLAEKLTDVLVSGQDVLQGLRNNQLLIINNRFLLSMTLLTILGTAILVPNTLATIFGFVYVIREEHIWWTAAATALSTVVATLAAYYWVQGRYQMPLDPVDIQREIARRRAQAMREHPWRRRT
jgi:magnesium transporter